MADASQQCIESAISESPKLRRGLSPSDVASVTDDFFVATPLDITDHDLSSSVWNSRAWTFQERLSSRRLIVFSHGHMIWQCRGMVCREDMTVADSGINYNLFQWLSIDPRAGNSSRHGVFLEYSTDGLDTEQLVSYVRLDPQNTRESLKNTRANR